MAAYRRLTSRIFPNTTSPLDGLERLNSLSQMLFYRRRLIQRCYPGAYTLNSYILRAVMKLERLVDRYMESIGAQRIAMPNLSPAHLWKETDRWTTVGSELFRLTDRTSCEMCLAPTHEETICDMMANHRISYKSLPLLLYQIGNKYRDEAHPKHGLLRSKEFLMKDLYTFDTGEEAARETYDVVIRCYEQLLQHLSLDVIKVAADTGTIGGSMSHEFHLETDIGEDTLNVCDSCGHAANSELSAAVDSRRCQNDGCTGSYVDRKGTEVAHAFLLGERYSKPLNVQYQDKRSKSQYAYMGCYGIGVTRLLAAAVETLSSKDHMKLPKAIAPYSVLLIPQKKGYKYAETRVVSDQLYDSIDQHHLLRGEVVMDDRVDLSIGARLREARLLGYPMAVCVSKKALAEEGAGQVVEVIDLYADRTEMVELSAVVDRLAAAAWNN